MPPSPPPTLLLSVLGPPGSGKGTQCSLLTARYPQIFTHHLSMGDVLRDEVRDPESPYKAVLEENLREGRLGAKEMVCGIIGRAIRGAIDGEEARKGRGIVLLDGFPRKLDTAEYFQDTVAPIPILLVIQCTTDILETRLAARKREDNDVDTIRKRIAVYEEETAKVVQRFEEDGKSVVRVDGDGDVEDVARNVFRGLEGVLSLRGYGVC
ncbi:unnamed protein product [Periconia digitata]|uniref:P-loop containing nucleoside triphosphate hydrolase protein n=1 Tax=Periconia digitata TaxID=1303443 RepID=A0A9W4UQ64_9PLEO|nr:unnamed protein product [Periconia digitata]